MATILILGAGMVSGPVIDTLKKHTLIIADKSPENITNTLKKINITNATEAIGTLEEGFLINDKQQSIDDLLEKADLAISLLPPTMHPEVARKCIAHGKHMVTASYTSLEMQALDEEAQKKNILLVNECGVDPGIDHMSAMKIIDDLQAQGKKITSFTSFCGGLPSNKDNNPMHYQFSWSPLGVLRAGKSSAIFLEDNEKKTINAGELFTNNFPLKVQGETYEGYYNRNSLQYIVTYGLEKASTFIRGTIRYPGWCATLHAINKLHLLEEMKEGIGGVSYRTLIEKLIRATNVETEEQTAQAVADYLEIDVKDDVIKRLQWLGLFSDEKIPEGVRTPLHALNKLMVKKMQYEENQTDMIVMQHEFTYEDGKITSSLVYHGDENGFSAMAKTVGLPVAFAAELVLEGKIKRKGVVMPITKDFYEPILERLANNGITFKEKIFK